VFVSARRYCQRVMLRDGARGPPRRRGRCPAPRYTAGQAQGPLGLCRGPRAVAARGGVGPGTYLRARTGSPQRNREEERL